MSSKNSHHHHSTTKASGDGGVAASSSSSRSVPTSPKVSPARGGGGSSKSGATAGPADDHDIDTIKLLSLEEVNLSSEEKGDSGKHHHHGAKMKEMFHLGGGGGGHGGGHHHHKGGGGGGARGGKAGGSHKSPGLVASQSQSTNSASGAIMNPQGASESIIRSGHYEINTLYASNDVVTGPLTVNVCNAPNNSTMQCGCENINCPFCNLMLSIERTDPTVLQ